jgi:DNA-binding transcriptional LysR family regulator
VPHRPATQPTLWGRIRQLEQELGVPIVALSGRLSIGDARGLLSRR